MSDAKDWSSCNVISNLTIVTPTTDDANFRCSIDFGSGETATALIYSDSLLWSGDHLDTNRKFVPIPNYRYHIDIWHDGLYLRANASGVIV